MKAMLIIYIIFLHFSPSGRIIISPMLCQHIFPRCHTLSHLTLTRLIPYLLARVKTAQAHLRAQFILLPSWMLVVKRIHSRSAGQHYNLRHSTRFRGNLSKSACVPQAHYHIQFLHRAGYKFMTLKPRVNSSAHCLTMASPQPLDGPNRFHNLNIHLTGVEDTLRRLLLDVADYIETTSSSDRSESQVSLPAQLANEKTVLRFTGGWVRDKLLGVDSHDIDVAINNMTGYQFGLRMKEYLELPGNLPKYGLEAVATTDTQSSKDGVNGKSKLVGGLHKIEANPEKSKHLETVTTRILGLDIDLVNLRKETYTEDSRNPQMEFGTPEEDALRRDATINAMFYNLNTLQIEDFTSRGFEDMEQRIIRTPLEPYQTFKDDPLRVLRLIRFASRLGYSLDEAAAESMRDEDIKFALKVKISRERVGVELEKMLRGPDPVGAIQMINDAGLYRTIFSDPTATGSVCEPDVEGWQCLVKEVASMFKDRHDLVDHCIHDADERYTVWILACLVPYRSAPQPQSPPGRKLPPPIAAQVAREGFKATNKVCDVVTASIRNSADIERLASLYGESRRKYDAANVATMREEVGMAIRQWGSTWRLQTLFTLFAAIADDPTQTESKCKSQECLPKANLTRFVPHIRVFRWSSRETGSH